MYNLDINFLKDRTLQEEIAKLTISKKTSGEPQNQLPIYIGAGVLATLVVIPFGILFLTNNQKKQITAEIAAIDSEISQLQAQNTQLEELRKQLTTAIDCRQALVSVFNQIKPVSVILQDISDQAPPGIQIKSFQQSTPEDTKATTGIPPVKITITGLARSFNDVNDFLLTLQRSDFLSRNNTYIISTQDIINPNQIIFPENQNQNNPSIKLPSLIEFTIESQLNEKPASDLIPQLTNKGATGLVTRINTLKEKGAIEP